MARRVLAGHQEIQRLVRHGGDLYIEQADIDMLATPRGVTVQQCSLNGIGGVEAG